MSPIGTNMSQINGQPDSKAKKDELLARTCKLLAEHGKMRSSY